MEGISIHNLQSLDHTFYDCWIQTHITNNINFQTAHHKIFPSPLTNIVYAQKKTKTVENKKFGSFK